MKYKIISAAIIALLVSGCDSHAETSKPAIPATSVGYVTVHSSNISIDNELPGRVAATLTAEVRPQINGIILKRLFTEGQNVKTGDILYEIDPSSYQALYNQASASVEKARASLNASQQKMKRYSSLVKTATVSQQDYDDVKATYQEDKASLDASLADLQTAKINLDRTKIRATIDGQIGTSSVTPGALVTASQTDALATIRNINEVYVDFTESSVELLKIKKYLLEHPDKTNNLVQLTLEDGSSYPIKGEISNSSIYVDESTGSVSIRAVFKNPQQLLLPGMYVRVKLNTAQIPGILVPQQAVINKSATESDAYIIDKNNKVKLVKITVSQNVGNKWIVTSGLQNDDKVITEGISKIQDGESVNGQSLDKESN